MVTLSRTGNVSSPYKGLMPYEEEDSDFFFGRTREVRLIIANLFAAPATVLLGSSGVGKSSILRAGVMSQLRPRSDVLPIICSAWREDPSAELRRLVTDAVDRSGPLQRLDSVSRGRTMADEIRFQSRRANRHLMIILDQFEEFFLYHASDHPFLDELAEAVNSSALNPRAADMIASALHIETGDDPSAIAGHTSGPILALRDKVGRALYRLSDEQREFAFRAFRHLVTPSGTRNTTTLGDLVAKTHAGQEAVEALGRHLEAAGVLQSHHEGSDPSSTTYYELTHDLLAGVIHGWLGKDDPVRAALGDWLCSPAPASASYVFSLREDALAKLDLFEGRIPGLMERLLRVENLDRSGGREAITLPLKVYNERQAPDSPAVDIEPALVDAVLDQVARGRIVLSEYTLGTRALHPGDEGIERIEAAFLQLVMTRLWEEERRDGTSVLRVATLERLRGAKNIVRTHLDQVMDRFSIDDQQLASRVFRYLITPSGAKIAHSADDLADYTNDQRSAVERLLTRLSGGSDRILRPVPAAPERPDAPRYEIFHDRLGHAILGWLSRFSSKEAAHESARQATVAASSPVSKVTVDEDAPNESATTEEAALCLSGSGYRAMLFHVGALWRLNELGIIAKLSQVSSVSTGSFVAAKVGLAWRELEFDERGVARQFENAVVEPLRQLATRTIDFANLMQWLILPGSAPERLVKALDRYLFKGATLVDLPNEPRFVLVASNMQTGAVWRFSRKYMGDYLFGRVHQPTLSLGIAAACSSALPPVLSPMRLKIAANHIDPAPKGDIPSADGHIVFLTDGLVLDRLAIETVWKRYRNVLVSDGTGKLPVVDEPASDWVRQTVRVLEMVDWQARGAQKRQLIESFRSGARNGAYWGIASAVQEYGLASALPYPPERTSELAMLSSRLKKLDGLTQERLINWGYAVCDAAIRSHYLPEALPPKSFPYPSAGGK